MRILHWLNTAADLLSGRRRRRKSPLTYSEQLENRALLTPFIVTSFDDGADANPGDGVAQTVTGETTLRAAVQEANALPGDDQILLFPGEYALTVPDAGDESAASGSLDVTDTLSILGAASEQTTIDANAIDQLFELEAGAELRLEELTITGVDSISDAVRVVDGTLETDDVELDVSLLPVADATESSPPDDSPGVENQQEDASRIPLRVDPIVSNNRQAELLTALFLRPVRAESGSELVLSVPSGLATEFYSHPDAAIGIEAPVQIQELPGEGPAKQQTTTREEPGRLAQQPNEDERATTKERRREVINILFEKGNEGQSDDEEIQATSVEKALDETPDERPGPPPLPIDKADALPLEDAAAGHQSPQAPPLPELKSDEAVGQQPAAGETLVAGIALVTVTRPRSWRRKLKQLTGWKWLVV